MGVGFPGARLRAHEFDTIVVVAVCGCGRSHRGLNMLHSMALMRLRRKLVSMIFCAIWYSSSDEDEVLAGQAVADLVDEVADSLFA